MWPNFARSHSMIFCGLLDTHGPPVGGVGVGGVGAGAAGVRNDCVVLHPLVVSPSPARERQKSVALLGSGVLLKVVLPGPSFTMPAVTSFENAWSLATWNS
jgi:hypothetical protein